MDIYPDKKFCVYLTSYKGNKLPQFYIGSSTVERVLKKRYRGTVKSKKYRRIWEDELKNNPNLFKTIILSTHRTRKDALEKENKLQTLLNVVKSPMYINLSTAAPNGFFGNITVGKDHINYISDETQPKYIFISPFNEIIVKRGMKCICEQYNLSRGKFLSILKNPNRYSNKGWRIYEYSKEKLEWLNNNKEYIEKTSNTYIAINKNKEIFVIINSLPKFCKKHNLTFSVVYECIKGKYEQYLGWRFFKYNKELYEKIKNNIEDFLIIRNKLKFYIGIDKNNIVYKIEDVYPFCKTINVTPKKLYNCAIGKAGQTKSWRFFEYSPELYEKIKESPEKFGSPNKRLTFKKFQFISPENEIVTIENLPKFCSNNNLNYGCMLRLNKGGIKTNHRGWKRCLQS